MAATIKISITDEIARSLERLKRRYPTLDMPELVKLSVGEFDRMVELQSRKEWADSLPILELNAEEQRELTEALDEADREEGRIMTVDEIMAEALGE